MSLEDLLGTPSGYASPQQIASVQQYADLLMKGGQRDKEITSPWQGVRMMADTLAGKTAQNQAGQQQMANLGLDAQTKGMQSPPGAPQAAASPQGGIDPQTSRTFALESGRNPAAITGSNRGLAQFSPDLEKKYGITNWQDPAQEAAATQKESAENAQGLTHALGRQPSPGEIYLAHQQGLAGATALLTNPQVPAWQAVRKFYPSDAVAQKAIAGNPPGGGHIDPNVPAGSFAGAWVKQFESKLGAQSPTGGQTADLSGHIGGSSPPQIGSPQAMSGALMAANTGGSTTPPLSTVGSPALGPEYATQRPQVSREMMQKIWISPTISPEEKQMYYQQYMQQYQPLELKTTGGHMIFPPGKPGIEIPDLQKFEESAGDAKTTTMGTVSSGSDGQPRFQGMPGASGVGGAASKPPADFSGLPPIHPPAASSAPAAPGPQSALTPPSGGPQGAPSAPLGATAAGSASPMGQMAEAGAPTPSSAAPVGAKTASLGGSSNVQSDAPSIGGMLDTPPPSAQGVPPPPAGPAGPQIAQNTSTGSRLNDLAQFGLSVKKQGELNSDDVKKYTDNSNNVQQAGTQADQGLPLIKMVRQAVQDPKFYSGLGADAVLDFKKLKAAIGSDPNAAAAMEIFEKGRAGDILNQLKSKLQGLGQVRLAEINLVDRATANPRNTPAGNMAVLDIIERGYNQVSKLSQLAQGYASGARLDSKGNYVPAKPGDLPTNAGLNNMIQEYLRNNPTFNEKEISNFNKTFDLEDKGTKPKSAEDKLGDFYSTRPPQSGSPSVDDKINAVQQRLQQLQGK